MKIEEIIKTIKALAKEQGFYCNLYNNIMKMSKKEFEEFKNEFEKKNFKDAVELVMYLEGGE